MTRDSDLTLYIDTGRQDRIFEEQSILAHLLPARILRLTRHHQARSALNPAQLVLYADRGPSPEFSKADDGGLCIKANKSKPGCADDTLHPGSPHGSGFAPLGAQPQLSPALTSA